MGHAHANATRTDPCARRTDGRGIDRPPGGGLAHTAEYVRTSGLRSGFSAVHVFMGPVGVLLVLSSLVGVHSTVRLARQLELRLAHLRGARRRVAHLPPSAGAGAPASFAASSLLAVLFAAQCGLYLLQENLEALFAHRAQPGLHVFAGPHLWVTPIHLVVALALTAALWLARRRVSALAKAVRAAEAHLFGRRRLPAIGPFESPRPRTPIERWGSQLWSRPPPALVAA